jgi:cyclin H
VYLACKVEEFNVSIQQFVANVKGDRNKAMDIILSNELLLMQELNFHLTIHNPYRPVEGFLIDIKTRCQMQNPDRLRKGIDEFLDKSFLTDACLIYAPSQIALAAVLHAASKEQENLDAYVTESLFGNASHMLKPLIESVRSECGNESDHFFDIKLKLVLEIRSMYKNLPEVPDKNTIKSLEKKLDKCRNQSNNPDSEM